MVSRLPVPMSVLLKKSMNPIVLSTRPSASTPKPYIRVLDTSFEDTSVLAISGFCASSDADERYSDPPRRRRASSGGGGAAGAIAAPGAP